MSYNIKDLEMIQGFIIRNEASLKESLKYDTLDKLQKEMEREILYTRHIESGMPRVFISSQEDEKNFKDFGMATGMVAVLVDKNETIDIQGIKSSKNRMTAMVINGVGLNQIDAEVLGELIVYNDLIKLDSSKDLVELARAYRAREVQDDNKVVSTRPAPKPTVEKEVIDTNKVREAMDKEVKDAQNLLGVKSVKDTVEDQVNAEKKIFNFKMNLDALKEDNNNAVIQKFGAKSEEFKKYLTDVNRIIKDERNKYFHWEKFEPGVQLDETALIEDEEMARAIIERCLTQIEKYYKIFY